MNHAFVTGASGFIGSAIVRCLLRQGFTVRALLRTSSPISHLDPKVEKIFGDLRRIEEFKAALNGCDVLFHAAADYRLWTRHPEEMYTVNVDATEALIRAAVAEGVERVVYTSSVATLGLLSDGHPADETVNSSLKEMHGHYKRSKYLAEQRLLKLVREEAFPIVIVNPAAPVGPGDVKPTPTGQTILDAIHGRIPAYLDTGLDIVHVDDVAQGHLQALLKGAPGRRYILGSENMTLKAILNQISAETGRPAPRIRLPYGFVLPLAYCSEAWARLSGKSPRIPLAGVQLAKHKMFFTSTRARQELDYAPRPAKTALSDAVAWFQSEAFNLASRETS